MRAKGLAAVVVAVAAVGGTTAAPASATVVRGAVVWKKSGVYDRAGYSGAKLLKWKRKGECVKSDNSVPARLAPNGRDYWTQVILGNGKRGWMRSGSLSALASDGCSL